MIRELTNTPNLLTLNASSEESSHSKSTHTAIKLSRSTAQARKVKLPKKSIRKNTKKTPAVKVQSQIILRRKLDSPVVLTTPS